MRRLIHPWLDALSVTVLGSMVVSCAEQVTRDTVVPQPPSHMDDGWDVASLQDVGLNAGVIEQVSEEIAHGGYGAVNGLLMARSGKLVWEEYYRGFERHHLHELQSVTKAITSALIGMAVARKSLEDVKQPIYRFFPEYEALFEADGLKKEITIQHLLTMTAGIAWDESVVSYTDPENDMRQLVESADWLRFVLEKPMAAAPGTRFAYNGGCTLILGAILQRATGMQVDAFAERYLFEPLGIAVSEWAEALNGPEQMAHTAGGLRLRARDLAKIASLYLNGGSWNKQQIIPEEWIQLSITPHVRSSDALHYGYQWWVSLLQMNEDSPQAMRIAFGRGFGGQYVLIIPDLQLLVVVLGGNYEAAGNLSIRLINDVLKAVGAP